MGIDVLLNPAKAEGKPWEVFFVGVVFSSIALLLSYWVFDANIGIIMVALVVTASVPLVYNLIRFEEEKDMKFKHETDLLKEHAKALSVFVYLFLGFLVSFSLWYVFLPGGVSSQIFSSQTAVIQAVNSVPVTGNFFADALFGEIFTNNLKVLVLCFIFSLFYGAGAIFILAWNASVLGVAVGGFIKENLQYVMIKSGISNITGYMYLAPLGLLRYSLHGIPEALSFFIGGLAGGILSIAIIKYDFMSSKFKHILVDALCLMVIAVVVLAAAAVLEIYVIAWF